MMSKPIAPVRVYADTSVYGGVYDDDFKNASKTFFEQVQCDRYRLVTSPLLREELREAPLRVRSLYDQLEIESEQAIVADEAVALQQAYMAAGIVSAKWAADALHVAIATVNDCKLIVSWNFKHIVSFRKIPLYNGVNMSRGFGIIAIHSPSEVIEYDEKNI